MCGVLESCYIHLENCGYLAVARGWREPIQIVWNRWVEVGHLLKLVYNWNHYFLIFIVAPRYAEVVITLELSPRPRLGVNNPCQSFLINLFGIVNYAKLWDLFLIAILLDMYLLHLKFSRVFQ